MAKRIKEIAVAIIIFIIMFVTCGADSIGVLNVVLIYAICFILWRVLKLKEVISKSVEDDVED